MSNQNIEQQWKEKYSEAISLGHKVGEMKMRIGRLEWRERNNEAKSPELISLLSQFPALEAQYNQASAEADRLNQLRW